MHFLLLLFCTLRKVTYQPNKRMIIGHRPAVVSLENFTTARMEEKLLDSPSPEQPGKPKGIYHLMCGMFCLLLHLAGS